MSSCYRIDLMLQHSFFEIQSVAHCIWNTEEVCISVSILPNRDFAQGCSHRTLKQNVMKSCMWLGMTHLHGTSRLKRDPCVCMWIGFSCLRRRPLRSCRSTFCSASGVAQHAFTPPATLGEETVISALLRLAALSETPLLWVRGYGHPHPDTRGQMDERPLHHGTT